MGLIKRRKFRPDGEDDQRGTGDLSGLGDLLGLNQGKSEKPVRKGGLIKKRQQQPQPAAFATNFLDEAAFPDGFFDREPEQQEQAQPQAKQRPRRGRVLKARWVEDEKNVQGEEQEEGPREIRRPEAVFTPTSFVPSGSEDSGEPRSVVMIPSSDQPDEPEPVSTVEHVEEFKVEEPEQMQHVDVEAIIAEAEEKAREKASKIIEHAQAEAKKLIDQARVYGETAKQEAHQEGFKLGKEDGYKAGLAEFTSLMDEAKNLFTQLVNERSMILNTIEPELAKLSIEIAEKVIGDEVKMNPDVVISIARKAMSKMKSREEVSIKVNPQDLEHVKQNRNVFASLVDGIKDLEFIGDPRVDRGGCIIETNLGNTDARVKTQIGAIELAFKTAETGTT